MPSSPNYVRDLKQEAKTAKARGEDVRNRERKRARYALEKEGVVRPGDGKDVNHKVPLSKGGSNARSNLEVTTPSKNRAFPRNSDGSMKANRPKKGK